MRCSLSCWCCSCWCCSCWCCCCCWCCWCWCCCSSPIPCCLSACLPASAAARLSPPKPNPPHPTPLHYPTTVFFLKISSRVRPRPKVKVTRTLRPVPFIHGIAPFHFHPTHPPSHHHTAHSRRRISLSLCVCSAPSIHQFTTSSALAVTSTTSSSAAAASSSLALWGWWRCVVGGAGEHLHGVSIYMPRGVSGFV